jgi:3-hydroxybutyrate dehydrogenase
LRPRTAAGRRQGGRQARRADERDLPRLRAHTPGRQAIPEQAKELGISEAEVVKTVMLKETVDGEFTTVEDVAQAALLFAGFDSNALTGQSLVDERLVT